jgi:hypothetical protein
MRQLVVCFLLIVLSASANAQTINACAKNRGGALRIVTDPADCSSRETPLSWNVQGPKGDSGDPGIDGEPGPSPGNLLFEDVLR